MARLVVQSQQLFGAERDGGVGLTVVVAELHLIYFGPEVLDDGPHLASLKTLFGHTLKERNYR